MNDTERVKTDDPFLRQYHPSELRIASEFLTTWLRFLSRDLCHGCSRRLSQRIRSLDAELEGGAELSDTDSNAYPSNPRYTQSYELNGSYRNNYDANSVRSSKDEEDTNSLGSWKYLANGFQE
ncbi:hypothetical protein like AT2G17970 [Hibiscus trionum]|uniref:Uncharacterized protein n=1 Tax=Hibiscus trionum TaxID=183268 RepID=A0A9W7H0N2_HIBTR|nr:hypothetical protein like AT2G17970 [Hibiscus trionum]